MAYPVLRVTTPIVVGRHEFVRLEANPNPEAYERAEYQDKPHGWACFDVFAHRCYCSGLDSLAAAFAAVGLEYKDFSPTKIVNRSQGIVGGDLQAIAEA